jgi:hypothetical protein
LTATEPLARAVFALLVLACVGAFFVTQRLKHTPTAVQRFELTPRFSPTHSGHIKEELISFKLAQPDQVTVSIENSVGNTVATLVRDWPLPRYKQFSLGWNGREGTARGYTLVRIPGRVSTRTGAVSPGITSVLPSNGGVLAAAGEYRVRVSLRREQRTVRSPRSFILVR